MRDDDAKTGDELVTLMTAISFSPVGSQILTGSQDRTARVWDAKSGAELFTLQPRRDLARLFRAAFDEQHRVGSTSNSNRPEID